VTPGAVVRALFDATNRRDWEAAMDTYADDVVLEAPEGLNAGTYRGRGRVGEWFGDWMRTFRGRIRFEIRELCESGDEVALWAHHTARGAQSGIELEDDFFYLYRVRDEKIVYVRFCDTWAAAVAALEAQRNSVGE
jgi:ketosteroid isomerase-like protein